MALHMCIKCFANISDENKTCPHCNTASPFERGEYRCLECDEEFIDPTPNKTCNKCGSSNYTFIPILNSKLWTNYINKSDIDNIIDKLNLLDLMKEQVNKSFITNVLSSLNLKNIAYEKVLFKMIIEPSIVIDDYDEIKRIESVGENIGVFNKYLIKTYIYYSLYNKLKRYIPDGPIEECLTSRYPYFLDLYTNLNDNNISVYENELHMSNVGSRRILYHRKLYLPPQYFSDYENIKNINQKVLSKINEIK